MTFAIFIVLILGLFIAVLNILPTATAVGFSFAPAITTVIGYMHSWDFLFPIHELLAIVGIMIAFEISVWIWQILWRITKFMRGHSDGA